MKRRGREREKESTFNHKNKEQKNKRKLSEQCNARPCTASDVQNPNDTKAKKERKTKKDILIFILFKNCNKNVKLLCHWTKRRGESGKAVSIRNLRNYYI